MGKIALAWDDVLRTGSPIITASNARAAAPAVRVATAQPSDQWKTDLGVTTASLFVDLATSRIINGVFVGNANWTSAATWRIRLSTSDPNAVTGTVIDTGTVSVGMNTVERCMFKVLGPGTGRYFRMDVTDASVTNLETGVVSPYTTIWRPPYNFQPGLKRLFPDFSIRRSGPDGQQRARRGSMQSGVIFTLPAIAVTELRTLAVPMVRYGGLANEVCVCLDPDDATDVGFQTFRGFMEETPQFEQFMNKYGRAPYQVMRRI